MAIELVKSLRVTYHSSAVPVFQIYLSRNADIRRLLEFTSVRIDFVAFYDKILLFLYKNFSNMCNLKSLPLFFFYFISFLFYFNKFNPNLCVLFEERIVVLKYLKI